jgi:hypothetical protein
LNPQGNQPPSLPRRLLWFVVLWASGVATVGTISYILRLWLAPHH